MQADPDATLYQVTATLTEPETHEHRPAEFENGIVQAIEDRRPEHARGWSAELPSPTRCILHADIETMTQEQGAVELLTSLHRALFPLAIRPPVIEVRVDKVRVEVSYQP